MVNLSFCFNFVTSDEAKRAKDAIYTGKNIKSKKCILKSTAEYPSPSKKSIKVNNLQIYIFVGEERLFVISSGLILVLYFRYSLNFAGPNFGVI